MVFSARLLLSALLFLLLSKPVLAQSSDLDESRNLQNKALEDLIIPRRKLDKSRLGINAFANDPRFGPIRSQFREAYSTLGMKQLRILFAWNDQVQSAPNAAPFFGYYDELVRALPAGSEAIVVLTGVPSWVSQSRNWVGGSAYSTFVELWVKPVVSRYKKNSRVIGFQLWNEPNDLNNPDNIRMGFASSPDTFLEFMVEGSDAIEAIAPRKLVINGATTAIAQNYPATLQYNRALIEGGLLKVVDIFAIHFYGKSIERLILPDGVGDLLRTVTKPVWVTESGAEGVLNQRDYAQRIFPYLLFNFPVIKRIYIYQFTDSAPAKESYGLKTLDKRSPVSDLYVYLRGLR
jgi:hypothetical protein